MIRVEKSLAARVLESFGISLSRVRVEVEKQIPRVDNAPSQDMTLTPRAKRVIDLAYDEARNLYNVHIGTEHLLLGLVREGDSLAGRVLSGLGVELQRARREVMAFQEAEGKPQIGPPLPARKSQAEFLPYAWSAYDDEARKALYRAKAQASGMGETHLTPLHLILGLLDDPDSGAVKALRKAGIEPERLRESVEHHRTWAEGAPEDLHLSRNGRKVMDAATLEAQRLSSDRLGSEHILLGLARGNPDGLGRIFAEFGVSMDALRNATWRVQHPEDDADSLPEA